MLQVKNIFKQYKTGGLIQKALDDVSFPTASIRADCPGFMSLSVTILFLFLMSNAEQALQGLCHAVFVAGSSYIICFGLNLRRCVSHSDTDPCGAEHRAVV